MNNDIESRLAEGFERCLFQAACKNLADRDNPLRFNNFSYATRELIRHVLSRHAPDDKVRACSWYKEETEKKDGVSRRQRVFYAVQGGLSDEYVKDTLSIDILDVHTALLAALDNLSKHTHIEEATFNISVEVADQFVQKTLAAVMDLFKAIETSRDILVSALWEQIDKSIIDTVLFETIGSIDELSLRYSIEAVYTEKVSIIGIDSEFIKFEAGGTIAFELQYRSDDEVMEHSFPFSCELWSSVDDPQGIQTDENAVCINTNYFGDRYCDE